MNQRILTKSASIILSLLLHSQAFAQNQHAEDTFREVFVTAGLSAAFGAAAGAALLPFFPESPMDNLRFVAGGASLGFLGGSVFAFYNLSQRGTYTPAYPARQNDESQEPDYYAESEPIPQGSLIGGAGKNVALRIPTVIWNGQQTSVHLLHWKF